MEEAGYTEATPCESAAAGRGKGNTKKREGTQGALENTVLRAQNVIKDGGGTFVTFSS